MTALVLLGEPSGARVLLVKPTYRAEWIPPGGIVEADESPMDGAARELFEETGIQRPHMTSAGVGWCPDEAPVTEELKFVFRCAPLSIAELDSITLEKSELSGWMLATAAKVGASCSPRTAELLLACLESPDAVVYRDLGARGSAGSA